ncbi:MAG: adenylate cyclase, partial [Planctomycetota bacterium]|nr:adenylate cyclase [Planctomycetota bacterium]
KATSITDESIDSLMNLTNLEDLNVAGTQLSDESFRKLGTLPKLKKLNVANTSIGFDVIDELAESNEDLEVIEFEN